MYICYNLNMNKKGFTLVELLITIAVLGILAAIAVTSYVGSVTKAARSEAYTNLDSIRLLEEEFFALNARYTGNLGEAGSTITIRDTNLLDIQTNPNDALPGFRPGNDAQFAYRIVADQDWEGNPLVPCFRAIATGIDGTRVAGDTFAIDCNNDTTY
jgi:prepilin-type N-terminal cleavage/methylation domain-containing protein